MHKTEHQRQLRDFLFGFISDNKRALFENIIKNRTRHISVVLEDIYQPHNASAVLRSADLFGVQDIHIIENKNQYEVNPDVALGSSKWLSINKYNSEEQNTIACFNSLREKGYRIVATTPHKDEVMLDELPLDQKTALVFGTELQGLSEIALQNADAFVKIPMYGFTESFNISVSAALSLFSLTERMRKSDLPWQLSEEEQINIQIEWAKSTIKKADLLIKEFEKKSNQY